MLENTGDTLLTMLPDPEGIVAQLKKRRGEDGLGAPPIDTGSTAPKRG